MKVYDGWNGDINSLSLTHRRKLTEALMRKPSLLLIGLAALIGAAWLLTDARTRLTLYKPNGFIQSGSALGVAVGDTRLNSQRKLLQQGMALQESTNGGTCFYRAVKSDRQLDLFFV